MANALEDVRGPVQDLAVLEAQDGEAGGGEPMVTHAITERWREVASPIGFDDEARLVAEEVDHEGTEGLLPAKLRALEPASSQPSPELSLCGSLRSSQRAGAIGQRTEQTRHGKTCRPPCLASCVSWPAPLSLRERGRG